MMLVDTDAFVEQNVVGHIVVGHIVVPLHLK